MCYTVVCTCLQRYSIFLIVISIVVYGVVVKVGFVLKVVLGLSENLNLVSQCRIWRNHLLKLNCFYIIKWDSTKHVGGGAHEENEELIFVNVIFFLI